MVGEYFYIARVVIICLCFSWGVYVILNDIIPPGCMGKIAVDLSDWLNSTWGMAPNTAPIFDELRGDSCKIAANLS